MQNLTEGSIFKVLMKLSLPIMASAFLATAYSITDLAWIGTLGSSAVAGVGVGGMYVWLSQGLATLARMGGQVPVAQELGRGNSEEAKKYAVLSIWLVTIFGLDSCLVTAASQCHIQSLTCHCFAFQNGFCFSTNANRKGNRHFICSFDTTNIIENIKAIFNKFSAPNGNFE